MSHEALVAYLDDLKDGGTLIVDPDLIKEKEVLSFVKKHNIKFYKAPVTRTAEEKIGIRIVANIVMIGAITRITHIISEKAARKAVAESVPLGTEDKNMAAFNAGAELAKGV
jgi:2-oxoglutarate ferredoxin oxidoreductase subunit gamma